MSVKIFLKSCDNLPHSTDVEWGNFSEPAGTIALSIHWISLNSTTQFMSFTDWDQRDDQ